MAILVAVLMANLALGAPLPLPQDVIATTTLAEPELASLLPALDFFSTFVFSSTTESIPIISPAPSPTSSFVASSQSTSQAIVQSSTSSSAVQQETSSTTSSGNTGQPLNNNQNVQTEVTHGPVTFGELTTPSEGGTFNKFVENEDGTNSSITGEAATSTSGRHSFAHVSTFAANTLTSYALFTQSSTVHQSTTVYQSAISHQSGIGHQLAATGHQSATSRQSATVYQSATVHLLPTEISTSGTFSTRPPAPSPTSKASVVNHNRPFESHEKNLAKRLFPSLFKDNEGFDRFDVPGFSHGNNKNNNDNDNNGKDAGQFIPPNVVPAGASLFGSPSSSKGNGKGSNSESEGSNNANNGDGNGSEIQDSGIDDNALNSTNTNDLPSGPDLNPFSPFPPETSAGPPPGLFLPPPPRGLTNEPPEPMRRSIFNQNSNGVDKF